MVDKQIKLLLHDHDCVVIPEFGGLIARYVSARIHPVKHTLVPPSKKIAFNEKLVLNDGLLISAIAHSKKISQQEAQQEVAAFVFQAREKLKQENKFLLQDIGVFRYNAAQRLEFEFTETENLLDASFGLPELVARPVMPEESKVLRTLRERQAQPVTNQKPLRRRLKKVYNVAAGLLISGATVTGFYLLSLQTDYNLSSLNPIALFNAGSFLSSPGNYNRYTADYVPLTEEERAAAYQQALPLVPVTEQQSVPEWQSFASGFTPATEGLEEPLTDGATFEEWGEAMAETEAPATAETREISATAVTPPAPEVKATVAASVPAAKSHTLKGKDGRAYIITGGYSTLENAEYSRRQIQKQGYEPVILIPGPGSKLFRVAVANYATEAEAHAVKREYRKIFGETIWVLKN